VLNPLPGGETIPSGLFLRWPHVAFGLLAVGPMSSLASANYLSFFNILHRVD